MYVALPVLKERENLEKLFDQLSGQSCSMKKLVVCVNNYEHWWGLDENIEYCRDNLRSIDFIKRFKGFDISLIDRSSPGRGWEAKKGGIGWARKVIMDEICREANDEDLIVSIDADTEYPENYLAAIKDTFTRNPGLHGLAIPYYHRLSGEETDCLILRYELYMRNYLLNMMHIRNPYAFTAIGSAMAFPVWAYKKAGGLTPVKSGEDFYFLQKLAKNGQVSGWTDTVAYPSPRFSDRVIFGTGPALIKGKNHDWDSYPIYGTEAFAKIRETYELFESLKSTDINTPMSRFLEEQFGQTGIWKPLRENYRDMQNFRRACHNKVDGLRILQFFRKE